MKTFAELCKGDLILFRDEKGNERRGLVDSTYWRDEEDCPERYKGKIDVGTLDGQVEVREADYIRNAKLANVAVCKAPYDELVLCAAHWLAEHGDMTDVLYMLGNKIHKYLDEAWLGGCDDMEVDNA